MTADIESRLAELEQRQRDHAALLAAQELLGESVRHLAERHVELLTAVTVLQEAEKSSKHKPRETVKWWDITDEARELEVSRLRGWERDVLVPVLGYYMLPCWPLHIPACARMEIMHELFMVLFLSKRTPSVLASQAEYFIRQLPGLADDIKAICSGCEHAVPKPATTEVA